MKVKLVNLDIKDQFNLSGSGWVPPLGLISIATYLKKRLGIEPIIYDSTVNDESEITKKIVNDCDEDTVVGFYTSILNYPKVINLAQRAKERKATVVLGGPHVSALEEIIMRRRKFIDAVISGQGELPFAFFLEKVPMEKIPNLSYRNNNSIIINSRRVFDINKLPLDYSVISLAKYWKAFLKNRKEEFAHPISYYTQKGCSWGKCIFCAIPTKQLTRKSPEKVWREIQILKREYQIDYIYETGDSFTDEPVWQKELAKAKPPSLNLSWDIFSRANTINEETVKYLKRIGTYKVFIGVETGDPELLRRMNKGHTLDDVINATKLLKQHEIKLVPTFMCGVAGETKSSLKKTIGFAKRIREISEGDEVRVFPMTPLPNSTSYRMLLTRPNMKEKYINEDCFDVQELQKDWRGYFCEVGIHEINAAINKVKNVYEI